uniref:Zeta-carotene desaturase, chloroplastic/chromoplastic n=1 Tax=Chaetoceros debilis TaxID=122233 RepID=A0A7S3QC29_9STRA|mmetsp:Transcript_12978/g.18950  ORF Transcript_12978/g.18950 Transcript_12978/m.18950 type:complete len:582 (+) Transcript_12978:121-1866(+)|eukprot:CAMPEP_0194072696 /NCGR_PEP_ID=MMETSP0149-20130528/364_1 /TAXON_ID=122233 /ORGANISM="Chaetoceros debilis, Strain MM31A-1" /LENGTH=581 /DNA_ID=CAMNT_0038752601 /DNA_START=52 /DNA_END=1797 /DNA_ORIENTATION=+
MVRFSFATLAIACSSTLTSAFVVPQRSFAVTKASSLNVATTNDIPDFVSEAAKKQVGNDSFLNKDLMARAQNGPGKVNKEKLKIGIVGAGLAGMVAAMDLADAGHDVEMFELRPFVGGKVSSWQDKEGNHIEMGLHVFFGCYYNLFGIMKRTGSFDYNLRIKEHIHTFVNEGGHLGALDFKFPIGAPVSGLQAFFKTEQLEPIDKFHNAVRLGTSPIVRALVDFDGGMDMVRDLDDITFTEWFTQLGGSRGSLDRMWDPIAYALGFLDCDNISARAMLTIFMLFAIRTEASVLRMLDGSPQTGLHDPIIQYLEERNVKINLKTGCRDIVHELDENGLPTRVKGIKVGPKNEYKEFDVVVAALDVPGIKKVLPESFRQYPMFDNIYNLDTVPIATVQLRFDGWVTEMSDMNAMTDLSGDKSDGKAPGIDNLLYSADAEFSCFADLALTSPGEYYKEGEGSLIQAVFDERAFGRSEEQLVKDCVEQINSLFPSSKKLTCTWSNVVKLGQSLYREKTGQDKFRPKQATPIDNFFLCGSYTYQDYLDSMEGATRSGLMVADEIIARADGPNGLAAKAAANAAAIA